MTSTLGSFVTYSLAAPPAVVFDAWVTPRLFATWWGGSDIQVPLESVSMEARPGGTWAATMILGDNVTEFHWRGEFIEVNRPTRLELTMTDEPGDERELLTVDLTAIDDGAGTEMHFSQTGGHLPPEGYEAAAGAWQIAFGALDTLVSK